MNDTRNIIDYYRYWETDAIVADLDSKRNNFSILCANVIGDFNIGTCIRNGNAFLAKEVLIYGRRKFDRRGTVGTDKYSHLQKFKEIKDLEKLKNYTKDYHIVGIDNIENSVPIHQYSWPTNKHVLMVFGEENCGIPKEILDLCHDIVYIEQLGSVRSLNVGVASGLAMFSYCQQNVYV